MAVGEYGTRMRVKRTRLGRQSEGWRKDGICGHWNVINHSVSCWHRDKSEECQGKNEKEGNGRGGVEYRLGGMASFCFDSLGRFFHCSSRASTMMDTPVTLNGRLKIFEGSWRQREWHGKAEGQRALDLVSGKETWDLSTKPQFMSLSDSKKCPRQKLPVSKPLLQFVPVTSAHLVTLKEDSPSTSSMSDFSNFTTWAWVGPLPRSFSSFWIPSSSPWASPSTYAVSA